MMARISKLPLTCWLNSFWIKSKIGHLLWSHAYKERSVTSLLSKWIRTPYLPIYLSSIFSTPRTTHEINVKSSQGWKSFHRSIVHACGRLVKSLYHWTRGAMWGNQVNGHFGPLKIVWGLPISRQCYRSGKIILFLIAQAMWIQSYIETTMWIHKLPLSLMNKLNQTEPVVFKAWMLYFQRINFHII